ncbi:MAG: hypothetical protein AAB654_02030, partial [Acidobacteriota bacterium]
MDAGVIERLGGIDIAQPGHPPLVHQEQLGRLARADRLLEEAVQREGRGKRLRAQAGQQFRHLPGGVNVDNAERARVREDQPPAACHLEDHPIEAAVFAVFPDFKISADTQMHADREPAREIDQDVLAPAADILDRAPR